MTDTSFCASANGNPKHECNAFGFHPPVKISLGSSNLNDDFCDCADGSDEGETNACDILFSKRTDLCDIGRMCVCLHSSPVNLSVPLCMRFLLLRISCMAMYQKSRSYVRLTGRKTKVLLPYRGGYMGSALPGNIWVGRFSCSGFESSRCF